MKRYEYGAEVQSVSSLTTDLKNKKIDLNPLYQRDVVWTNDDFSNFIESVMMGVASPNITFNNSNNKKTCIDGKQRCTSLFKFANNEISLNKDDKKYFYGPNLKDIPDLENHKNAKIISEEERCQFDDTKLNIIQYKNLSYDEQIEVFTRLQYGKHLTAGEKVLANITDINSTTKFKEFCESKEKILKKHYKNRNAHYTYITDLMYLVQTQGASPMDKKNISNFLTKLTENDVLQLTYIVSKIIDNLFTPSLLNSPKIIKLKLSKGCELPVLSYAMYDSLLKNKTNLSEDDKENLIKVIKSTQTNINKKGRQKYVVNDIIEKFNNNYDIVFHGESDDSESDSDSNNEEEEVIEEPKKQVVKTKKIVAKKNVVKNTMKL
jgi:hypothetical protein